jgi:hypothetical protein
MSYYEGIICHVCGKEVCQTCGSCHEEHTEEDLNDKIEKDQ